MSLSYELHEFTQNKSTHYRWCAGCEGEPIGVVSFASDSGVWLSWVTGVRVKMFDSLREAVRNVNKLVGVSAPGDNPLGEDSYKFTMLDAAEPVDP